jgi:hypothetical protein
VKAWLANQAAMTGQSGRDKPPALMAYESVRVAALSMSTWRVTSRFRATTAIVFPEPQPRPITTIARN